MDDKNSIGRDCSTRFHSGRAVNSDIGPLKSIEYIRKIGRAALFAMLPWNVYAEAEQFPGVRVQLDGLVNAAALVDSSSAVVSSPELIPDQAEMIVPEGTSPEVNTGGENPQSEFVNQELASLDVVDTGVLKQVQNPQPAPIVPLDKASLKVVDTGTSRQVHKKPQPVGVVPADAEAPAALESEGNVSTSGEADELNTAAARVDDHQARNYMVMLPVTDVAEKYGQPVDASGGATSEETVHLPYAVLLTILALMSMIPVARRKD